MLQVAIVEDDRSVRQDLTQALWEYSVEKNCSLQIQDFQDGCSFWDSGAYKTSDIVLLDIQMPGMDGMTLAHQIRRENSRVVLIFVTSMVSYAVQGYRVEALDFLVKPIDRALLFNALDRAIGKISQMQTHYINVRVGSTYHHIDVQDLFYVEAGSHKIFLHTKQQVIECSGTIHGMEKELEPWGFFCCHSAFVIRLGAVTRVEGMDALLNGERIPVSKHRRKALLEKLAAYWGAQL